MDDYATALAEQIDAALPGWVVRSVERLTALWLDEVPPEVASAAESAGQRARAEVMPAVRVLLATDIDQQATTPLAILRTAVRYPAEVLAAAGVPPVQRDAFSERAFPDDAYDLTPATFADVDPALAEAGIVWGAAKAYQHKLRHRP
jgi:hypothetical protein